MNADRLRERLPGPASVERAARSVVALTWASWRSSLTYRLRTVLSLFSLLAAVVPVYFLANALQSTMADSIQGQGDQYFGFLVVGMVTFSFMGTAVSRLPSVVSSGIDNGTLEALFSTPPPFPVLLGGMSGYGFVWTAGKTLLFLMAASLLGANLSWAQAPEAALILVLIVLAHLPFGILAAAGVLAFRTSGPLSKGIMAASGLLGGVYYPTQIVPSWIEPVSGLLPVTYGLRALRRIVLEQQAVDAVLGDVMALAAFAAVLLALSLLVFRLAFRYARRSGTLAQY